MGRNSLKVYLDTNVLLDIISTIERPSVKASLIIYEAVRNDKMEAVLSTQSILDAAYILSKEDGYTSELFTRQILYLLNHLNVRSIDSAHLREALILPSGDLENNAQYALADSEGCDILVTSDRSFRRDRTSTSLPVFTPEELVARMTGKA